MNIYNLTLNALSAAPSGYMFFVGDDYGYHGITDAIFISDDKFINDGGYKNGQIVLTGVVNEMETFQGTFKTDGSKGTVSLTFNADGTASGIWKTFIAGGAINIEKK